MRSPGKPMLCIAHRGARGLEPENTLLAIRAALELRADGVEIDVHLVEGELIVIHDDTLDRTTNGSGPIVGKSLQYLRSLDAGKGERIPFLNEILDAIGGGLLVNIELKGPHTALPTLEVIARYEQLPGWSRDRFLVSSFDHRELALAVPSGIPIGVLWNRPPRDWEQIATRLNASSVHPQFKHAGPRLIERAHRRGMKVFPYTVNAPGDIQRMRDIGADGIFTDHPERFPVPAERIS